MRTKQQRLTTVERWKGSKTDELLLIAARFITIMIYVCSSLICVSIEFVGRLFASLFMTTIELCDENRVALYFTRRSLPTNKSTTTTIVNSGVTE